MRLEKLTLKNNYYRFVLQTTKNMQLVLMSLKEKEFIPKEKHKYTSQFIRIEKGKAKIYLGNKKYILKDGDSIVIPPNTQHEVKNVGKSTLKLYTIYTPPEHNKNLKQKIFK